MQPIFLLVACISLISSSLALSVREQQPIEVISDPLRTMGGWSWRDCGLPTDTVEIQSIEVSPDPPKPGKDLTVTVKAVVQQEIVSGATADVTVKLGLIKLLKKKFDICEEALKANATVQCPVKPGPYIVTQTVALPKEIPRAKFNVDIVGFTAEEEDMLCVKLSVDFMTF